MAKPGKSSEAEKQAATMRALVPVAGGFGKAARGGLDAIARLRSDAEGLLARNRAELEKALAAIRRDLQERADRTLREIERRVLRQLNAASAEQLGEIERRVAELERSKPGARASSPATKRRVSAARRASR